MKGSKDFNLCRHRSKSKLSINRGVVRILICVDTDLNPSYEGKYRFLVCVDTNLNPSSVSMKGR